MNKEKTLKNIIDHTLNWMNKQPIYQEDYDDIKAGCLHKIVERRIKERFKYLWPHLNIYHPADNSGKPDIFTDIYNKGIELKCTFGWPTYSYKKDGTKVITSEDGNVVWTNGTVQSSTEYFLLIKLKLENNRLIAERTYFGKMSYSQWKVKPKSQSMYIRESVVKDLCKQIK